MSEVMVAVSDLGKRYRIGRQRDPYGRLTESLSHALRAPWDRLRRGTAPEDESFWALRSVSFEVRRGEVVGIIGRNGAGKTTLLKILSRITEPTTGTAQLRGRVASLLEVGTGFHPELTGRENVYMSGAVLGMRGAEITRKFDEIVAFAGVEEFLDTPVKRYSSGMQVRLGFAVAAHLEPEILIVDEVLAVGDAEFQRKSLGKLEDVSGSGRTVLFVSHNLPAVEALCSSVILLDNGAIVASGEASATVETYLSRMQAASHDLLDMGAHRRGSGALRFVSVSSKVRTGSPSEIRLRYEAPGSPRNVSVGVSLSTMLGEGAAHLSTDTTGDSFGRLAPRGEIVCRMPKAPLLPGRYSLNLFCTVNNEIADWVLDAATIDVMEGDYFGTGRLPPPGYGASVVPHDWIVETG